MKTFSAGSLASLPRHPCVLIFNSLPGEDDDKPTTAGPVEHLRDYLRVEWARRRGGGDSSPAFTEQTLPGYSLDLPRQHA